MSRVRDDVQNVYAETRSRYGPSTSSSPTPAATSSAARSKRAKSTAGKYTLRVNLLGVYYTCKYAIADLKSKGGHIIVTGSGMGHRDGGAGSAYSASKAAVWMLVRNLATELRDYGICVNELIPGWSTPTS